MKVISPKFLIIGTSSASKSSSSVPSRLALVSRRSCFRCCWLKLHSSNFIDKVESVWKVKRGERFLTTKKTHKRKRKQRLRRTWHVIWCRHRQTNRFDWIERTTTRVLSLLSIWFFSSFHFMSQSFVPKSSSFAIQPNQCNLPQKHCRMSFEFRLMFFCWHQATKSRAPRRESKRTKKKEIKSYSIVQSVKQSANNVQLIFSFNENRNESKTMPFWAVGNTEWQIADQITRHLKWNCARNEY